MTLLLSMIGAFLGAFLGVFAAKRRVIQVQAEPEKAKLFSLNPKRRSRVVIRSDEVLAKEEEDAKKVPLPKGL